MISRHIIKKIIVKVLLLAGIKLVIVSSAIAVELRLTLDEHVGSIEDEKVVTVFVENAGGLEGGQFVLIFDPNIVAPVEVAAGPVIADAADNLHMANLDYDTGKLNFMWITAHGDAAASGELCYISFSLLQEGETLLDFEEIILAPDGVELATGIPGRIIVQDSIVKDNDVRDKPDSEEVSTDVLSDEFFSPVMIVIAAFGTIAAVAALITMRKVKLIEKKAKH